jgi:F-type H+/Na+-transporting ATPase subunit alpha
VAKLGGLADAMYNEMLVFGRSVTGLVLNLEEIGVGTIVLSDYTGIKQGQEVRTTGKVLQVPGDMELFGRVVNALGAPVDHKGPIRTRETYPVEKIAPGIIRRKSVNQPDQTGIMAIDAMIPIGHGQTLEMIDDFINGRSARSGTPRLERATGAGTLLRQMEYAFCFAPIRQVPACSCRNCQQSHYSNPIFLRFR